MINKTLKLSLLAVSVSTLVACGGSSSSSDSNFQPVTPTTVSGRVIDGPLAGSTVTFVDCENQTTTTDANGYFNFPAGCTSSALVVTNGIDSTTDLPFNGILTYPKQIAKPGANHIVVTPLTTLVESLGGAEKASVIANILGLSTTDLLSADPTKNQALYAKTVAVQQLVEEIQQTVGALGVSLSNTELAEIVFKAVAEALATTPTTNGNPLTNTAMIASALDKTLDALKDQLPTNVQSNLSNVKANLATLIIPSIAGQITDVETTITNIPNFSNSADNTDLIKQLTKDAIVDTKASIGTEKVIGLLNSLLVLNSTDASALLATIAQNINSETPDESAVESALNQLATLASQQGITFVVDNNLVEGITNSEAFYENYLNLDGLSADGAKYSTAQLLNSIGAPLKTAALDNLLVHVNAAGNLANSTQTVGASLKVDSTQAEKVSVSIDKLKLTFNASGALSAATIPSGAKLDLTSNSRSATVTLANDVNALQNGSIALNTTVLTQLLPDHLKSQLAGLTPTGATTVTATLNTATPVAYTAATGLAVAPKYNLGHGITAKFNVGQ